MIDEGTVGAIHAAAKLQGSFIQGTSYRNKGEIMIKVCQPLYLMHAYANGSTKDQLIRPGKQSRHAIAISSAVFLYFNGQHVLRSLSFPLLPGGSPLMMGWVLNASAEINSLSKYPTIIAVCIVLTLLMIAVVFLRIYVHFQAREIRADDYVIITSMVRELSMSLIVTLA